MIETIRLSDDNYERRRNLGGAEVHDVMPYEDAVEYVTDGERYGVRYEDDEVEWLGDLHEVVDVDVALIIGALADAGEWAHGGEVQAVAREWREAGFWADDVREWLAAKTWEADAARALSDLGVDPDDAARTVEWRGSSDTYGYWISNGDMSAEEARWLIHVEAVNRAIEARGLDGLLDTLSPHLLHIRPESMAALPDEWVAADPDAGEGDGGQGYEVVAWDRGRVAVVTWTPDGYSPHSCRLEVRNLWTYSAYTDSSDGATHRITGTLEEAEAAAEKYARETFPAWDYEGYGPTIIVADPETGERIVERRL